MFRKLSLKSKLIIFVVIAIVSIGIVIKEKTNNKKNNFMIENKTYSKTSNVEIKSIENK